MSEIKYEIVTCPTPSLPKGGRAGWGRGASPREAPFAQLDWIL